MNDIAHQNSNELPSTKTLLKATAAAIVIAAVTLVTFVLPAEYGIDVTGLGTRLGLTAMSAGAPEVAPLPEQTVEEEPATDPVPDSAPVVEQTFSALTAVWKSPAAYRTDEMSLTLKPDEGAEIKAKMRAGERFVFTWTAEGGVVNFDMHGEELGAAKDEFTSYWKGRAQTQGHGAFVAPFDGTHGWYWRNRGNQPVTVRVRTSGFYEQLFRP